MRQRGKAKVSPFLFKDRFLKGETKWNSPFSVCVHSRSFLTGFEYWHCSSLDFITWKFHKTDLPGKVTRIFWTSCFLSEDQAAEISEHKRCITGMFQSKLARKIGNYHGPEVSVGRWAGKSSGKLGKRGSHRPVEDLSFSGSPLSSSQDWKYQANATVLGEPADLLSGQERSSGQSLQTVRMFSLHKGASCPHWNLRSGQKGEQAFLVSSSMSITLGVTFFMSCTLSLF